MEPLALIVAYDQGRVIGNRGRMPWRYPEDLKHFRRVTMGRAIIVGRVNYLDIGRPLPGRTTVVLTRDPAWRADGVLVAHDLAEAIALARRHDPEPFIAGGAQVYEQALPLCTRLHLTEIAARHEGDVFFPALPADHWRDVSRRIEGPLTFRILERIDHG